MQQRSNNMPERRAEEGRRQTELRQIARPLKRSAANEIRIQSQIDSASGLHTNTHATKKQQHAGKESRRGKKADRIATDSETSETFRCKRNSYPEPDRQRQRFTHKHA